MFIFDWFSNLLQYFGFGSKKARLLFVGLDDSGKTTLLGRLKTGRMVSAAPTHLPTSEHLSLGGIQCTAFDLGGHPQARRVWRDYYAAVDAIIFLVDASNVNKLDQAARELQGLISEPQTQNCPILVLGNKIDKVGALSEYQLKIHLDLQGKTTGKDFDPAHNDGDGLRAIELFMCSILTQNGYGDGFRWLAKQL